MEYNAPKGLFDILPVSTDPESDWKMSYKWQYIESVIRHTCATYGFQEIRTPVFEKTELFIRSSGESSDIVSKEMYTFEDKAGRSMSLRPEGTAPVMRAIVEHRLFEKLSPLKLFYIGPMFRYDRPQAGRYRQHHQFGAEAIGSDKPEQDAEVISLVFEVYRRLGIQNLQVHINSVGDQKTRQKFSEALQTHLQTHFDQLSKDSQVRFHKNPLRILDSKDPQDILLLNNAPQIADFLQEEDRKHFEKVCALLKELAIPYTLNSRLVRGLDYYNRTVFEVISQDLGAQSSIGGGGRYDGLLKSFGGPDLPSAGFGTGMERILQTMERQKCEFPPVNLCDIYILPLGEAAAKFCFSLTSSLRNKNVKTELDFSSKKIQTGLQTASKLGARFCLIIGDSELSSGLGVLKNLSTKQQLSVPLSSCFEEILQTLQL